ncbi:F0F1 ATP synthase subunit delta [uncultured Jatrophihabitans sp.]|uniref:F0F1 ATP synthase subunit delta n=1 Tax=uncultured Jatrophihabitans sp. TaxID=1610747 RepID=UPI0035CAC5D6
MMRSASRQSLDALLDKEREVFGGRISAATLTTLSGELYAIADLLVRQPRLRRTLGDPAASAQRRSDLLEQLLSGKVEKHTLTLATTAVGLRWSTPWDLTDALEDAGDEALFAAAEKDRKLDTVEDELFRFERIMQSESSAVALLDDAVADADRRNALLDELLSEKVNAVTLALLHHAVASTRKRSVLLAVDDLLDKAAVRQERSIARVVSAVALTDAQQQRLEAALTDMYGRTISVRTAVDPEVRGGLVVRVGDEVIDGSIATRLAQARSTIGGQSN